MMKFLFLSVAIIFSADLATAQSADTLTLTHAIQLAIQESPQMKQGLAMVDVAKAKTDQLTAYLKPQVELGASYTRIDPTITVDFPINGKSVPFSFAPNNNYQAALTLQQNIYDFGRAQAVLNVSQSGEKSAQDALEQYKSLAAYQTVQYYFGLLATDESLRIEQDQLKVLRETLGITEEREKAGTATTLDPLNFRVRISSIQSQMADLQSIRLKQESALRRLTGLPSTGRILVSRPARASQFSNSIDSLRTLAELHRTEIQVAKDAEQTALLLVDVARRTNSPVIAANVSGGVKDGYPPNLTDPKLNWAGTLSFHMPILDGGRAKGAADEAEANYRVAQSRTLDLERGITSDIEQGLADVQANESRIALTAAQIEQARQAYDIALVRYKAGTATNLDVLTAQSALEQANLQRAQLTYNFELSQYNLNRAIGTPLW